ncbi:MAG: D-alanine--D-alanine ligase [Spirochaetia bacterium]|jgi:D-alanine-D-alanine ligase
MTVGLTYDLRTDWLGRGYSELETAEFDREETVAAVDSAIRAEGCVTERIGDYRGLMGALSAGKRWDLVFNFCEGMYGLGREALVPALLDASRIPYTFSDPVVLAVALHKGLAKRVVRDAGVPTPDFAVVESVDEIKGVALRYPLFAKPIGEGTGKGITPASRIGTPDELRAVCEELLKAHGQPVLVEEYLPGREFTTGIIGTGPHATAVGTMEVILLNNAESHAYTYLNKEYCEDRVRYELASGADAEACGKIALQAWRALGGRDAGRVDIRLDAKGNPSFIEVNPLAGLHPEHSDLPIICTMVGITFQQLIGRILTSARRRAGI